MEIKMETKKDPRKMGAGGIMPRQNHDVLHYKNSDELHHIISEVIRIFERSKQEGKEKTKLEEFNSFVEREGGIPSNLSDFDRERYKDVTSRHTLQRKPHIEFMQYTNLDEPYATGDDWFC